MTIKDLREILKHYEERKYDDWEFVIWDYQNQRRLEWLGGYSSSNDDETLAISVINEPDDGVDIMDKLKKLTDEIYKK